MLCEFCQNPHDGSYGSGRFCNQRCSRRFAINKQNYNLLKIILCPVCHNGFCAKNNSDPKTTVCPNCKESKKHKKCCKYCGQLPCLRPDICKKYQLFSTLISKFGMNESVIGSIDLYREYERIQTIIREDYIENKLSSIEMAHKYNHRNIHDFTNIMKALDIKRRTLSESCSLAFAQGKLSPKGGYPYKHGYHTTWNNKKVYYRSSYEEDYYKILDTQKVDYEVESLRIQYWDSEKNKFRTSIPDIYISSTNTIIEIKGQYTFDLEKQNIVDKFNAYKQHRYNTKLILEKQEVSLELIGAPRGT